MDEDTVVGIFFIGFLLFVFSLPVSLTACVAASKTRKWAKSKTNTRARANGIILTCADVVRVENEPLVEESDSEAEDSEIEYLDSEDEAYHRAKREQKRKQREEKEADALLSTRAKFIKEWKACWKGPARTEAERVGEQKFKEQEERRKIAREAVREYLRLERKKARKALISPQIKDEGPIDLPTYSNAVGEWAKS